jgi:hypothetical protein
MRRQTAFAFICLFLLPAAAAGPADYVFLPGVTYGEREIDFKAGSWKKSGDDRASAASIGFGYGITQNWFSEIYRKYERTGGEGTHFDAWEWENKLQLTEPGQFPVDAGFILEIERPQDHAEGYEVVFGPLFQTETSQLQFNGNILFEQHYRSESAQRALLSYQWQAKYRWQPALEFGLQGFGNLGSWNHWDAVSERAHRLGPAVFGKVGLGNRQAIRYNAAWLIGTSSNAPSRNFRAQVEFEF